MGRGEAAIPDFIGRAEELDAVRAAVEAGGCVLTGAQGIGKSRLAAEVARGFPGSLEVLATASAAATPFGAFQHLLTWKKIDARALIPGFIERIRADHPGRPPPVMVVDDAHLLDDASAALVLACATTGVARPLVTIRTPNPTPDAVTALWKERGLDRLTLESLGRAEIHELIHGLLGGVLEGTTAERIHQLSLGNPLYAVELVHDARRTGALFLDDGRWRWRDDLLEFDRLADLIGRRVRGLSPGAMHALELIAVGGMVSLGVLEEIAGAGAHEELERQGLTKVRADAGDAMATAAHPLIGEVVAASLGHSAGVRLRRELASSHMRGAELDDDGKLRVAVWRLDAGEHEPQLFVAASGIAVRRGSPELAMRLAERAGDTLEAAHARGVALVALARFDEADAAMAPYRSEAAGLAQPTAVSFVETRFHALICGSHPDAEVDAFLDEAEPWHRGPSWAAFIATLRAWVRQHLGEPADSMRELQPWLHDGTIETYRRFHLLACAYYAQLKLGRTDDALASAEEIIRITASMTREPWLGALGQRASRCGPPRGDNGEGSDDLLGHSRLHDGTPEKTTPVMTGPRRFVPTRTDLFHWSKVARRSRPSLVRNVWGYRVP